MTTYSVLGKSWRCRKFHKGYCRFGQVLGRDRGFLVEKEFLVLCHDRVPCAATWLLGFMQLLGRDIVFPCHDSVFLLCRDNVATEVSLSRPRRSR